MLGMKQSCDFHCRPKPGGPSGGSHTRGCAGSDRDLRTAAASDATSQRIELAIGKDLQFIRINGTIVGGLAGLAIYFIAKLF